MARRKILSFLRTIIVSIIGVRIAQIFSSTTEIMCFCYHFVHRQNGETKINDFMQAAFYNSSSSFNQIHNHSGTLFEGPLRAILIDKNKYLLHLCRYIHRNPLEAGMVIKPERWHYSNYAEFIGKRKGTLVAHEFVKMNFGSPETYEDFVMNYIPPEKTQKELRHYLFWD